MSRSRRVAVTGIAAATAALTAAFIPQIAVGGRDDASTPTATAGQGRVLLLYNCRRGRYKPAQVIISCADANFRARSIDWSSWTATEARGRGTALVNDCEPNCAEGTFRRFPIRLRAFRPRMTGGCVPGSLFTRLAWRFPQSKPEGFPRRGRTSLVCPASGP